MDSHLETVRPNTGLSDKNAMHANSNTAIPKIVSNEPKKRLNWAFSMKCVYEEI